jgi:DNA-binding beta-propeller fold protein YncE
MVRPVLLLAALSATAVILADRPAPAAAPASVAVGLDLQVLKTFRVGGTGGWDYVTVDPAAHRLYVARATRIMVLDSETGASVGEIPGLQGAHGVALVPEHNLGFATSGRANEVVVFDLKTLQTQRKIKSGQNPDAILYDPASKKVFALCGRSGDATVIDPANLDHSPHSLPIGGKLEAGVADGAGRVYVNVEDKNEVVAIDSKALKVLAHWPLAPAAEPTGLAIDVEHRRLFVGCHSKMMAVLDADSGKVLATLPIGPGVDGVVFDPQVGALSANGGDGTLTVVREGPAGKFTVAQTVPTVKTAKTIAGDPQSHRAYLPATVPGENGGAATFGILVVGPAGAK